MMSQVISITPPLTPPLTLTPQPQPCPESELYGTEVRKYYADGIVSVIRTNPGLKTPDSPKWYQVTDDNTLKSTHTRTISTEIKDETVTRFWKMSKIQEKHEYLSPEKIRGTIEIRKTQ
jgi:hypothetical protein